MIGSGRYAELEAKARKAIEQDPHSGLIWKALGVALRMQRKDSLEAFEKATMLLPDDAETHSNLGNALLDLRRLSEAAASYRRALEIAPHFAEAHSNLGNALQGLGQFDAAVAMYRRALQIKPQYAEAHNNLGNALRSLGRHEDAVASYRCALQIKPQYAEAHSNLGNAFRSLGRLDDSVASYRRAIDITPSYAEAHNNLANALLDLGRAEDAAAGYRRAIDIDPGFAGGYSNLSIAQRRMGQLEEAAVSCRRALELSPDFAGAHSNLGDALRDLGKAEEAAASCRRALELDGNFAGGHNSLGNALLDLGRLEEAAASYRRALDIDPNFSGSHINLGMVLRLNGRTAEAEASCRKALEFNEGAVAANVLMAELHADNGRFAQAEELFKRAVAIDPDSAEGWAGMAHLRKMTAGDSSWLTQAQRIVERPLPPRQEIYLRYALGKYFDDVRDFDQAFANYRRANELTKRHGAQYDRREMPRAVDLLIRSYGQEWTALPRPHAMSSARPVFIVGMPRSGTTLAEQILASHPAVFGAGELMFWNNASARHQSSAHNPDSENSIDKLAADYGELLTGLAPDAQRVVDKMPANFMSLGLIHAALPNARIIHLRRNPIDTCLSIYFQHFKGGHTYANDLEDLALYYREYERLMQHWHRILPAGAILDVPYEGLVDEQEEWTRKMLTYIDLPWDARCLDFHRTDRNVVTASKWQVRQKISKTSVDRWRNYEGFLGPLRRLGKRQFVPRASGA